MTKHTRRTDGLQERNTRREDSLHPSAGIADVWLDGVMIFAMVAGSLAGGVACALIITSSSHFSAAVAKAPMFLGWITLIAGEGALAWAGFWPSLSSCLTSGKVVSRRNIKWIAATLGVVGVVVATSFALEPRAFPLDVEWPLLDEYHRRIAVMSWIVMIPPFVAIVAMWFTAVQAKEVASEKAKPSSDDVAEYLALADRLQSLLWFVGVVIGGAVLATGVLRRAMLDGDFATEKNYPAALVLAYGAFFTLVLVISYVPPYLLVRHAGKQLVGKLIPAGDDVIKSQEDRQKLAALLGLDIGLHDSLKNSIAILAPIVAGFASMALK